MGEMVQIAKMDAARRQLETAIDLHFHAGDAISIHTLAAASRNILANLCAHREITPPISQEHILQDLVKPEYRDVLHKRFRESENFFKHADRDPNELLSFNPKASEFWIIEAVEAYCALSKELPVLLHAFRTWWMLHNREMLTQELQDTFRGFGELPFRKDDRAGFIRDFMAARYA